MSTLFAWPQAATVESRIARDRLFRQAGGGKAIRALYDAQVQRIDWAFKLFVRSVNLPPSGGVDEIEVFRLHLRGDRLDDRVLAHIDKAIPHPILFELVRHAPDGDEVMLAAAYKRRSEADKSQAVTLEHWRGAWVADLEPRAPLPQAASLKGLYAGLLRSLWPHGARAGESLRAQAERLSQIATQGKAVERLQLILRRTGDFARKTEINRELRAAQAALKALTAKD
ncbi:DUF4391 domain-containing protein [Hyphobacterium marinum]|uniref:DUF4391 domain-containing protein n=1 Tax=Hyphobacterium marinum TaxID=3116574 RepID=A0ABU7LWA7_9PROT|nr:DUF4391 domain-containing protein [Hyphobacterium sp. Y6023]MEE2565842.1 DUF4391 domain-containing protein [Hyphobacterium sp. Y6023]